MHEFFSAVTIGSANQFIEEQQGVAQRVVYYEDLSRFTRSHSASRSLAGNRPTHESGASLLHQLLDDGASLCLQVAILDERHAFESCATHHLYLLVRLLSVPPAGSSLTFVGTNFRS